MELFIASGQRRNGNGRATRPGSVAKQSIASASFAISVHHAIGPNKIIAAWSWKMKGQSKVNRSAVTDTM
jgi:hypothetical protein